MKTTMKSLFVRPSAAVAAAAVLAAWFTFSGSQIGRAEEPETLSPSGQDMVLMRAKDVHALEQRIAYLEETVAALTESWQHINTHRLCVSDDSGAETCITKAQLDSFLKQSAQAEIGQPTVSQEANASPPAEAVEIVATVQTSPSSEPTAAIGQDLAPEQDPETTGTVTSASTGPALLSYPKVEIYEEPVARTDE